MQPFKPPVKPNLICFCSCRTHDPFKLSFFVWNHITLWGTSFFSQMCFILFHYSKVNLFLLTNLSPWGKGGRKDRNLEFHRPSHFILLDFKHGSNRSRFYHCCMLFQLSFVHQLWTVSHLWSGDLCSFTVSCIPKVICQDADSGYYESITNIKPLGTKTW